MAKELTPEDMRAELQMRKAMKPNKRVQTVKDPQRMAYPGIYKDPREIAAEAAARVAPEDPAMKRLFGVNRGELYEMGRQRKGNLPGELPGAAANPRGAESATKVMTRRNKQRLLDVLGEAEKHPALVQGMDPWYVMDPMFRRMAQLLGPEKAAQEYRHMNTLMGMASPGSEVTTEIPRGSAAYYLMKQGRFPEFVQHAGKVGEHQPEDIRGVPGHAYHKTAQAGPMKAYVEHGEMKMGSPKVPMYIEASGVPETGFQTRTPVGDAHWSRAVGLADTRDWQRSKGKLSVPKASVSNSEMSALAPWWRKHIAGELGIESVPAQARAWGAFSPQTGVTTPIGAPKLELIAQAIMEAAHRLGVSPETARDLVLTGKARMGKAEGGPIVGDEYAKGGKVKRKPPMDPSDATEHAGLSTLSKVLGVNLSSVGADEAPDLPVKAYMDPDRGEPMQLPTGGVEIAPGQLLQPGQAAQPPQQEPGAPGMPGAQGGIPPGALAALIAQHQAAQGAPGMPQQPPSNILAMTRQGQAMNAMRPPAPGTPPMRLADGGPVDKKKQEFTHEVVDRDGNVVSRYRSLQTAQRGVDRLDNAFGASVHRVRAIAAPKLAKGGRPQDEAAFAIAKAAARAGMKTPVTAAKPLTTLQDTHDVLKDKVAARAREMQRQVEGKHRFEPGQHVFTEWSARNNHPPFEILGKTAIYQKRGEPMLPGYRVRHLPNGAEEPSEYNLPDHAIKGAVGD